MHRHPDRKLSLILPAVLVALVAASCGGSSTPAPASTAPSPSAAATTLKVALVAPSAVNDLAFTQSMVEALNSLKGKYNLEIAVSDNQFVVATAANVIQTYATQGFNLIIAHGSQYGSTIQQLAPKFPNCLLYTSPSPRD